MPHTNIKAVAEILPEQLQDEEVIKAIALYTEGLDEFVRFGSNLLHWESESASLSNTDIVFMGMYRRILELADSISMLLKKGSSDPCQVLLRPLFEVVLNFVYLMRDDTDRRAWCYRYSAYSEQLTLLRRRHPTDGNYKVYQAKYKHGEVLQNVPEIKNHNEQIKYIEDRMNQEQYKEISQEFRRLKGIGRSFFWYTLFSSEFHTEPVNGRKALIYTIEDLAIHLNKFDLYDILYKQWSKSIHSSDAVSDYFFINEDSTLSMVGLRQPTQAHSVTNITFRLLELTIVAMRPRLLKSTHKGDMIWWSKSFTINFVVPILDKSLTFQI